MRHPQGRCSRLGRQLHKLTLYLIVLQPLLETTALAVLALILAVCLSGLLAGPVGSMAEKLASPKNTEEPYTIRFIMLLPVIDKVSADPVNLTYGLGASNVLIAALAVLASAAAGVLVTSRSVLKMKPKDVLSSL